MKHLMQFCLCMLMSLLLIGCNASTASNSTPEGTETIATDSEKGKRSNPYSFGEDVTIEVKASDDLTARFIFNFSQAWDSTRIKQEYSKYNVQDACIIRGSLRVELSDPDGEISLPNFITARLITSTLNEEYGNLEAYKENELNNNVYTVYDGTTLDFIIKPASDSGELYKYIKLEYKDIEQASNNCWIIIQDSDFNEGSDDTSNNNDVEELESSDNSIANENAINLYEGKTISIEDDDVKLDITLNEVSFEDAVYSKSTSMYRDYYSEQDGETYILMKLSIKNRSGDTISYSVFQDAKNNPQVLFDNTYNYALSQMDVNSQILSPYWSIKPLGSQEVYFLRSIPDEIISAPFIITFGVGNTVIKYDSQAPTQTDSTESEEISAANNEEQLNSGTDTNHVSKSGASSKRDANEQEKYDAAYKYFNEGNYLVAEYAFRKLGNYLDSEDMELESKYLYVKQLLKAAYVEDEYPDIKTIDEWFGDLINEYYKDSYDIYEQLDRDWTAKIVLGTYDDYPLTSIAKNAPLCIRYKIKAKRTLSYNPTYEFTWPNGEIETGEIKISNGYDNMITFENSIWQDPTSAPSGTFQVRILDYTGKEHAKASIYVGN